MKLRVIKINLALKHAIAAQKTEIYKLGQARSNLLQEIS